MPQIFQVLKCYKCFVFQIHQTKKSNKFECKMCGEKQSIKRHYGIGTSRACRAHVQQLNSIRGIMDMNSTVQSDGDELDEDIPHGNKSIKTQAKRSKWSAFVDEQEESGETVEDTEEPTCLEDGNVLELPPRKKRNNVKIKTNSSSHLSGKFNFSTNTSSDWKTDEINQFDSELNHKSLKDLDEECNDVSTSHKEPLINSNNDTSNKQCLAKQDILKTINKNSKWAQFVNAEDDNENIQNDDLLPNDVYQETLPITKELFSLCGDSDLDNVLNI